MSRLSRSPFSVRHATAADAGAIARVHVASWDAAYAGVIPDADLAGFTEARRAIQWQRLLDAGAKVWVAEEDDLAIGFVETRGEEVPVLYLHPGWWRLGLGRTLLRTALATIRRAGHVEAHLWVLHDNAGARAFYASLGGREGETRPVQVGRTVLTETRYTWLLRVTTV